MTLDHLESLGGRSPPSCTAAGWLAAPDHQEQNQVQVSYVAPHASRIALLEGTQQERVVPARDGNGDAGRRPTLPFISGLVPERCAYSDLSADSGSVPLAQRAGRYAAMPAAAPS